MASVRPFAHQTAAMTGAFVSFAGLTLPYNLGLILGGIAGIIAGVVHQRMRS